MHAFMKDPVVQVGAPVLREKAETVAKKDIGSKKLAVLIQKMKDILAKEEFGVAIAAPQIGEPLRIFVIAEKAFRDDADAEADSGARATGHKSSSPKERAKQNLPKHTVFINPELIRLSRKKEEMSEGCLSVRGVYGSVLRHEKASVKALDEHGKPFVYHASDLIAHIFQHEIDHLDGILFIDKAMVLQNEEPAVDKHK